MARYLDRLDAAAADELQARLHELLSDAYATGDLDTAVAAYNTLIDTAEALGADHAVTHLRNAAAHAFTFATNPTAGRLVFGDKGRPELATGVLERVMREMNMSFTRCDLTRAFGSRVPQFVTPLGSVVFRDETQRGRGL